MQYILKGTSLQQSQNEGVESLFEDCKIMGCNKMVAVIKQGQQRKSIKPDLDGRRVQLDLDIKMDEK